MRIKPNAKTKSERKYDRTIVVLAILLVVGGIIRLTSNPAQTSTLQVGARTYQLEVVTTTAMQQKGLSGRASLPADQGMLFSFTDQVVRCFWMKDTRFPLDMIWLNGRKRVLHIESNVSPSTYPKTFCPNTPAQYVIELNAGQAHVASIATGQTLKF